MFLSTSAYGEKILIGCNSAEKEDMAVKPAGVLLR